MASQKSAVRSAIIIKITALFCLLSSHGLIAKEWNVGFQMLQVTDSIVDANIDVAIWYPTKIKAKQESLGVTTLAVAKDAKPVRSVRGLIIISHGFAGNFLGHNNTAQFLAKSGYVVATPTHPDWQGLRSATVEFDPLVSRPRHIELIIDKLLSLRQFKARSLRKRIGVIGFSLGAYSAISAIGAIPDLTVLPAYCEVEPDDELLCAAQARQRFDAISSGLTSKRDRRIKGAVLLAPAYGPLFSEKSFAEVTAPVRIYSAEKDKALDSQYHAKHFEELLHPRVSHEIIERAGHFVFMAPCSDTLKQVVPVICNDDELVDRVAIHQKINKEILRFFEKELK